MASTPIYLSPIPQGRTQRVALVQESAAGTASWTFTTEADAVLISLYVSSVSADLDIAVYTQTEDGKDLLISTFPTVSAPTANLLIKKATTIIAQVRVEATWSGAASFELYGRGVSSAESSVRVLGAQTAKVTQTTLPATPTLIVASSLTDRGGLIIKNNNGLGGSAIYFGFTPLEASIADGYPLSAQESLGMDISAGVEVYALSVSGTSDLRIIEAG